MTPRTHSGGRTVTLPALTQGDGILVVDADLKIVHINAPLQSLLSVTREELLGADASLVIRKYLFPLLSEGGFGEQIFALLRDGPCLPSITLSIRVPGAGTRRLSVTSGAVETATPVLRLLVFHDTGEAGREPAGESDRQLVTLMSNLPGMAYRCRADRDWTMEFVSEGAKRVTGYAPEDLVGNRRIAYGDLIHHDDRERVREEVFAGLAERRPFQMTYRLITASGEERWVWEQGRGVPGSCDGVMVLEGYITDITDRVRAEAALAESEERFRSIFEEAGIGILLTDTHGRIVKANPALQQILGYSADELQGMTAAEMTFPEDVDESTKHLAELVAGERDHYRLQKRYVTRTGQVIWGRATVTALRDADGTVRYTLGMVEDITARKQAEENLAESEERFRSIFTTSHAVMLIVDPETGAIVDANPAASAYYGYPLDTLTAMQITDINVLGWEELHREMRKAETGEKRHFLFRHRLADGRVRDVDVFSNRVVIHGRVLLHSIVHDVTERRRAEEHVRALLDAMPDATMLLDHDGTILALNEVMAARFGKSIGELIGTCVYDLVSPELAAARRTLTEKACASGRPLKYVDERGGMVLENILFPIPGTHGDAGRVAIISRDVTRQHELERARKEAFYQIEQNIEQFAILADHIRQPLQVILGLACLLEDEQATGAIQNEVARINGYIRQLDQGWIESRKIREYLRRHELV